MKRRFLIGVPIVVLIVSLGGVVVYLGGINKDESPSVLATQVAFHDPKTNVSLSYPEKSSVQALSEQDQKDNFILRLNQEEGETPFLITLRSESKLRTVASLTKASIIDILMNNSEKALPQRFAGYHKESSRRFDHDGRDAGEFVFTYDSPVAGERIKQRFVIIVKDDDTAVYLAMQSKEADYDEQNQKIFNSTANSLSFQ